MDRGAEVGVAVGAQPPEPTRSAARSGMAEEVGRVGTAAKGSIRVVGVRAAEPFDEDKAFSVRGICKPARDVRP